MGKLSKKERTVADTAELVIPEDSLDDEIIDLVDEVEDTVLALEGVPKANKGSAATLDEEAADENLETVESDLDMFIVDETDLDDTLDDTLDEELIDGEVGISEEKLPGEEDADLSFEAALLELFESTDSLAAKLIEESSQREETDEGIHGVDREPSAGAASNLEQAVESTDEKDEIGEIIEAEDELHGVERELSADAVSNLEHAVESTDEKDEIGEVTEAEDENQDDLFVNLELVKGDDGKEADAIQTSSTIDREPEAASGQTSWKKTGEYYPHAVHAIDKKVAEYEREIVKLAEKKEHLKKAYEHLRSILYLQGEELKKAVTVILAKYWSLKLSHMNPAKRAGFNENILIKYYDKYILAKVKATKSVSPSHKFITQLWQDLYFSGLGAKAVGALIVNYDTGSDPQDRSLAYVDQEEDQLDDIIFIDTRVLFNLTTAIVDEHLSVEDAKRILFRKGRVEFDSTDSTC